MITKGKQLRVLLLEDSVADAELVNEILTGLDEPERHFSILIYHAESVQEMVEMIEEEGGAFDVALIDLGLPDSSGMDTYLTARGELYDVPIVIMSGNQDEKLIVDLLRMGAQDYLSKADINIQSARLVLRTLVFAIERAELMIQLRAQQAAADLASIAGVLKEACRLPAQKLELAIKTGYDRRHRASLDRLLRDAYASSRAIAHTFESIHAAATEPRAYDAMAVVRDFAGEHNIPFDDSHPKGTVTGCPRSLWSALEFLLAQFENDRNSPTLVAENVGASLNLEFRAADLEPYSESEDHFAEISSITATLRDLPLFTPVVCMAGVRDDRMHRASRLSIPLANAAVLDS
ncbi:MAG: response regulator [Verrucomicrobiales bacterium]